MLDIIEFLKNTKTLSGSSMLDVGSRDCCYAREFVRMGFPVVCAFDPDPSIFTGEHQGVTVFQSTILDYQPDQIFDIVVCRHVLPFTGDLFLNLEKLLTFGVVIAFTTFGPLQKAINPEPVTHQDVLDFLKKQNLDIRYEGSARYYANNYAGVEKFWDVSTAVSTT
jgi:2-polyprenyl-3-methyl-5-hydroxy-6-metoxy-1,4-benzoquinol methylase